jgi:hypothetical protein
LLNRALNVSIGLAQIKPRTAQTASVLATGAYRTTCPGLSSTPIEMSSLLARSGTSLRWPP